MTDAVARIDGSSGFPSLGIDPGQHPAIALGKEQSVLFTPTHDIALVRDQARGSAAQSDDRGAFVGDERDLAAVRGNSQVPNGPVRSRNGSGRFCSVDKAAEPELPPPVDRRRVDHEVTLCRYAHPS